MTDDSRKPVLTPAEVAEGWRVEKAGGTMWVKTFDVSKLRITAVDPERVKRKAARLAELEAKVTELRAYIAKDPYFILSSEILEILDAPWPH